MLKYVEKQPVAVFCTSYLILGKEYVVIDNKIAFSEILFI